MNILYMFSEQYASFAGVSMTSLFINNSDAEEINVYILQDSLSENSKSKILELANKYCRNVFFPDTSNLLNKIKKLGLLAYRGTYAIYYRLFFSEIIDLKGERAIYLDADTIVTGNLQLLEEYDLKGKSIGMVLESIRDDKSWIGVEKDNDYYNSGVILFDSAKWISNDYCNKIIDHIKGENSYAGDQDILNTICRGDILRLPSEFNFQPIHKRYTVKDYFNVYGEKGYYSPEEIEYATSNVIIYHCYRWLGCFPWNKNSLHPFVSEFDRYLLQSLWKDYEKGKNSIGLLIRIERVLYRMLPKKIFLHIFKVAHELMIKKSDKDAQRQKVNKNS